MPLDLGALKDFQEKSGSGFYMSGKDITETGIDVRICPPMDNLQGVYFKEVVHYWFGKKKVISHATLGEDCIIETLISDAIEHGKATKDQGLLKLATDERLKKKYEFYVPIFLASGSNDSPSFSDPKILQVPKSVVTGINKIAMGKPYQNGTPNGIMDLKRGRNLMLTKTGEKLTTEYSVMAYPDETEVPAQLAMKIPDTLKIVKKQLYSEAYIERIVRSYFYNEPIGEVEYLFPELQNDVTDADDTSKRDAPPPRTGTGKATTPTHTPEPETEDAEIVTEQAEAEEVQKSKELPKTKAGKGKPNANLLNALEEM